MRYTPPRSPKRNPGLFSQARHLEIFLSDRSLLPFRDRCKAQQGEDAEECEKYAKYYRSLCPTEWVEKWNEERENGTWPGRY